jgi:hypothetical protein
MLWSLNLDGPVGVPRRVCAEGHAKISNPRQIEPVMFVEIVSLYAISASFSCTDQTSHARAVQ